MILVVLVVSCRSVGVGGDVVKVVVVMVAFTLTSGVGSAGCYRGLLSW